MKFARREDGFADVVIIVIIALVIVALATLAFYEWQHKTASVTSTPAPTLSAKATASPSPSASSTPNVSYLVITQWGVKLPLTSATSDLSYSYDAKNSQIFLSSASLAALDSNCGASAPDESIGGIQRLTSKPDTVAGVAHVGNYYYFYTSAQGGCSANKVALDKQQGFLNGIRSSMASMVAN